VSFLVDQSAARRHRFLRWVFEIRARRQGQKFKEERIFWPFAGNTTRKRFLQNRVPIAR
jgi:hypothetical protein